MKRAHCTSLIILVWAMLLLAGCKAREAASDNAATTPPPASSSASSASNANPSAQPSNANRANPGKEAGASAPAQLLGTYESREVEDKGVTTLISQLKTLFMFTTDGTYSRVSAVKGKTYHADSGTFRIEPPDKLVLTIQVTGQKAQRHIQSPPLSKTHKFSLSPDGEELRLTSEKGTVGIFRRVAKPKTS